MGDKSSSHAQNVLAQLKMAEEEGVIDDDELEERRADLEDEDKRVKAGVDAGDEDRGQIDPITPFIVALLIILIVTIIVFATEKGVLLPGLIG